MSFILRLALACLIVPIPVVFAAAGDKAPTGKLPGDAIPQHYALHLTVDPRAERFSGEARIRVKLTRAVDHIWLHAEALAIKDVRVTDAAGKSFEASAVADAVAGMIDVRLGRSLAAQDIDLDLRYDAPFNAQLAGLYKVKVGDDSYAITQMEPVSARLAFPGFDEPRFKTPFDIVLTVPKSDVAVANTRVLREEPAADAAWKTLTYATTRPLPTYLVAFAVGPWDVVDAPPVPPNAVRHDPLPLRGIGPRGSAKRLAWVLGKTPAVVRFYEDYTAQPYPFDKLDLLGAPDFSAGAMENAGLIVYRDALLLVDANTSADRYRSVFNVNAHEIAHQWYGDLVTVPWWDDIWLNEAYATWAQAKATTALEPDYHAPLAALESRLYVMASDSLLTARKIRQPIRGRGDIENAFDGITYQKGASVLAMFETWLGEDVFRKGMREYLARHAYGSGSSDDLIATLAQVSGKGESLAASMRSFLDQPGIPMVATTLECKDGKAALTLAQSRYLPYGVFAKDAARWGVPVCTRFGQGDGSHTQCFLLDKAEQRFDVAGGCPDWYLPNADARGYYRFAMDSDDLARLGGAVARLSAPEQLIYADAVASGFRRGELGPAAVLDAMPALARSDMPQVASALFDSFEWIQEHLADAGEKVALDAYARRLYGPRLVELGYRAKPGEAGTRTALRTRIAELLAMEVRDPEVRAELVAQGRQALGLDAKQGVDLARADVDLRETILKVTVQDVGAPAFDAVQKDLGVNRDTAQRYALLAALGSTRDPTLGARARDFGLDPAVQIGEMASVYEAHVAEPENRAAAWQWLKDHFDAYRVRLPAFAQSRVPQTFAQGRCSAADAQAVSAWFEPRVKDLIGGDRGLAQTVEGIRQCVSLREHVDAKALRAWAETHAVQP